MDKPLKSQWKITYDLISDTAKNHVGTCGGSDYDPDLEPQMTERWQCYDDDGELYYAGIATPGSDFAPLEDFCQPDSGCTEIRYFNPATGEWETL